MSDRDLLQEIRENRTFATNEWDDIRKEARTDKLCVAGKTWEALDPNAVKERKEDKRPFLSLDELGQYINQTVNDVRANPRGIKYAPTGNGANDKGAEFYQNHTREIEYRSHARIAYATAFENAVTNSYGWIRIRTKRAHVRTFDQDLYIEPVVNADQVLADPNAVWPDSRDVKFLYYIEPWSVAAFKKQFPKAKIRSFGDEWQKVAPQWIHGDIINVAEYWSIQTYMRRLVAFQVSGEAQPQIKLVDELPDGKLPAGVQNLRDEQVEDLRVTCNLTNGIEILKEQPWKGKYIPFVSCYGKILYVDEGLGSRRQILSMTRLARDPQQLYNYMATCEAEAVGGVPRATWVGYEGQFAKPDRWQKANRKPQAYLEAKSTVAGTPAGQLLPLPQKQGWDPGLQNVEVAKEAARRAIQAAMGITPLPTPVQRENQKSGKALERIESSGQRGSFHFVDHYDLMIERAGVILEDLMDKTLDTARDVPVRKPDDSAQVVRINDPQAEDPIFTKGEYRVTVSTGPATESQRAAADDFVDSMVSNIGMVAQIAGPQKAAQLLAKSVKMKQLGPVGDDIAELLAPPMPNGPNGKPLPPEVAALTQENEQLKGQLQQATQAIKSKQAEKQVEQQGKFAIAKMQEDAADRRAALDREVKLAVAELGAKVDRMALLVEESQLAGARAHESGQAARDRAHATIENAKDRAHDHIQAVVGHEQALEQADQAAALAPEPVAPTNNGAGA